MVVGQVRTDPIALFVEGETTTCQALHLLSEAVKEWVRDAMVDDTQICAEVETFLSLPTW